MAEIMKLVAYVENKKDPLIQTFRTHPYSKLKACTITNFKKSFQNENESKGIRNVIAQSIKKKWKKKRMLRQFTCITEETWWRYQGSDRRHGSVSSGSGN